MKKSLLSLLASALVAAAAPVWADTRSDEALGQSMQTYYKNPSPERGMSIMQRLMAHPVYTQQAGKTFTFNYWGALILQKNPKQTMAWCEMAKKHNAQTQLYAAGLFFLAQTPDMEKCFKTLNLTEEQRQKLLSEKPAQPMQQPITSPLDLDMLWSNFFATGNAKAVEKITDYAVQNRAVLTAKPEKPTMEDARQLVLEQAARWSLRSNVQQDLTVRQIVQRHAKKLGKAERAWLEQEVLDAPPLATRQ